MDFEKLRAEGIPTAQGEVLARRSYESEVESLRGPRNELEARLKGVVDFLSEVYTEFYTPFVPLEITLENVDEVTVGNKTRPAGWVIVELKPFVEEGRSPSRYSNYGFVKGDKILGFELVFTFKPTQDEADRNSGLNVQMGSESTGYIPESELDSNTRRTQYLEINKLPPSHYTTVTGIDALRSFADTYLPKRTEQITELEQTVARIKEVMDDNELNPWVLTTREERVLESLEARSKAEAKEIPEQAEATPTTTRRRRRRLGRGAIHHQ